MKNKIYINSLYAVKAAEREAVKRNMRVYNQYESKNDNDKYFM